MFSQHASRRDFLFIVCASVSWGTVGVANQMLYASGSTNALSLTFLRLVMAIPWFLLAGWISPGRSLFQIKRRDLGLMMLMGSMIAFSQACYIAAISSAGVSVSTLIAICSAPVLIALLSAIVSRKRLAPGACIALIAAVSGVTLLVVAHPHAEGGSISLSGILLAFCSAGGYAGFIFCGRLLTHSYHPLQISLVSFGTGAFLLFVCTLPTGLVLAYSARGWLILLYLGCVPTALGYGLFQLGVRSLSATLASIVTMCEPLTATVLAWIFFGEELGLLGFLGAGLLLAAMAIIALVPERYFA